MNQLYLQIQGIAMGTCCAPSYANLYLGGWERDILQWDLFTMALRDSVLVQIYRWPQKGQFPPTWDLPLWQLPMVPMGTGGSGYSFTQWSMAQITHLFYLLHTGHHIHYKRQVWSFLYWKNQAPVRPEDWRPYLLFWWGAKSSRLSQGMLISIINTTQIWFPSSFWRLFLQTLEEETGISVYSYVKLYGLNVSMPWLRPASMMSTHIGPFSEPSWFCGGRDALRASVRTAHACVSFNCLLP